MDWTRSRGMRVAAFACAVALVVVYREERNGFFWLGAGLVVLNVVSLLRWRRASSRGEDGAGEGATAQATPGSDVDEWLLADLLTLPGVRQALGDGPDRWRQVAYLHDETFDPVAPTELAQFIWIQRDDDWSLALGDEVKPFIDLDVPEDDDAVVQVLREHPEVNEAWHEDREVYAVASRRTLATETFAALAVRALVAGQRAAARRLEPDA